MKRPDSLTGWVNLLVKVVALLAAAGALWNSYDGKNRTDAAYGALRESAGDDYQRLEEKLDRYYENQTKVRESLASLNTAIEFLKNRPHSTRPILAELKKATVATKGISKPVHVSGRKPLPASVDDLMVQQKTEE